MDTKITCARQTDLSKSAFGLAKIVISGLRHLSYSATKIVAFTLPIALSFWRDLFRNKTNLEKITNKNYGTYQSLHSLQRKC